MGAVTQSILLELRFSYGNSCFSDLSRLSYGRPCSWGHCSLRNNGSSRHRPVDNGRQGEGSQPPNSLPTPRLVAVVHGFYHLASGYQQDFLADAVFEPISLILLLGLGSYC